MGLASIEPPQAFAALQALLGGPLDQMAVLATTHPQVIAQLCGSHQITVCAPRAPIDWADWTHSAAAGAIIIQRMDEAPQERRTG